VPIEYGPDTQWPPNDVAIAQPYYREWLAWYSGDTDALFKVYQSYSPVRAPHPRPSQYAGGARGALSRMWHGNPPNGPQRRLHVPAASDVATISSDMLYADPPGFTLDTTAAGAQGDLEDMIEESMLLATLAEAADQCAGAGGIFLRASINLDVSSTPVVEALLPDNAVPDFYGPFLRSVTFWTTLTDSGSIVRHLERHEMIRGRCWITHALFSGAPDRLGRRIPLTDGNAETRRIALLVDENGMIDTECTKLDVVYVPNVRPHRLLRGTMLGRSDFQGSEGSMDALDETWSSWMRDVRTGKSRILVPREYLRRAGGPGEGATWDPEQEIYAAINAAAPSDGPPALTVVQFTIRVQEHRDTVAGLWRTITSAAGLDTSDHDTENGPQQTATQVNDKGSRKRATRGKKIKYWTPALQQILWVMQELAGRAPERVKVEWPDASAPDGQTQAQTLQLLAAAGAVSTQTLVEMLHPDWDDTAILEETERIQKSTAPPEDPGAFGAPDTQPVDNPVGEDAGFPTNG
jgi:hypothetical protein